MSWLDPEDAARQRLKVSLPWRFPGERLLFTAGGRVDRMPTRGEWALGLVGRAHCINGACVDDPTYRDRAAVVGATGERLVYRTIGAHGLLLRVAAVGAAGLALLLALLGSLSGLLWGAAVALVLWILGRLGEAFGMGAGAIDFGHITNVDLRSHSIEGSGSWGTTYRVHIPDPSDFGMILAISRQAGAAEPA
jgi:hypothetical protein